MADERRWILLPAVVERVSAMAPGESQGEAQPQGPFARASNVAPIKIGRREIGALGSPRPELSPYHPSGLQLRRQLTAGAPPIVASVMIEKSATSRLGSGDADFRSGH